MLGPRQSIPWIGRAALLMGLLGALWITTPNSSLARPYPTDPGPDPSGDPTADDQPSPAPKPKHAGAIQVTPTANGSYRGAVVRIPWEVYLRLLVRHWVP